MTAGQNRVCPVEKAGSLDSRFRRWLQNPEKILAPYVKKAMTGLLQPEIKEVYLGRAEVKEVFAVSKVGTIAGCRVVDGKVSRNASVRLLRDDVVVYEGKISSLKRFKDDVKEVLTGYECGIGIEKFNDVKVGDVIEAFTTEEVVATL